jgi:ABC-type multidrug transport system ATPase subunit
VIRLDDLAIGPFATPTLTKVVAEFPIGVVSAIIGPAGSGKTQLLETIVGLRPPIHGAIRVAGIDPTVGSLAVRRHVTFVPAGAAVLPHLTPIEQVQLVVRLAGDRSVAKPDIVYALRVSEVPDRLFSVRCVALTAYQRLCVWLAIHRARKTTSLLLDDPVLALTAGQGHDFARLLRELASESTTILIATRDLFFAEETADRSYRIDDRRIALQPPAGRRHFQQARV